MFYKILGIIIKYLPVWGGIMGASYLLPSLNKKTGFSEIRLIIIFMGAVMLSFIFILFFDWLGSKIYNKG